MRLNVTPIGSGRLSAGQIAKAVVEYLAGVAQQQQPGPGLTPPADGEPSTRDHDPATGYYADSIEGPGRWLGLGASALGLDGPVDHDAFARVLEGRHPLTGERLLTAQGSADRGHLAVGQATRRAPDGTWLYGLDDAAKALGLARSEIDGIVSAGDANHVDQDDPMSPWLRALADDDGRRWVSEAELDRYAARSLDVDAARVLAGGPEDEVLTIAQAAQLLGVGVRYLQSCARYWEDHRTAIEALDGADLKSRHAWLVTTRGGGRNGLRFQVTRAEVAAFAERRQRPVVRVGYDLTLSTEKSVAVLALLSGSDRQRQVLDAIDEANRVALGFLESHAAVARRQGRRVGTEGLVVASFLHATSRALDPFPHRHNVVANAVVDEFGERRALDGRALYRHAPAAAALATAAMRWRLSNDLGIRWRRSPRGIWEAEGVPDTTIREFSKRRDEVDAALAELSEALGRPLVPADTDQVVLATRAAKARTPVEQLRADWLRRARSTGLGRRRLAACFGRPSTAARARVSLEDESALGDWLDRTVVEQTPTFSRGEVIEAICRWSVNDELVVLPPVEIERLADRYLASERVVELDGRNNRRRDSITRADGVRVDATGGEPTFTTFDHLRREAHVLRCFDDGLSVGTPLGDTDVETAPGWATLSPEQQSFVRAMCTSGMAVQCAVGRPGAGKTHSLSVAARAWEVTGHRVIGAAVKGEAARLLADATSVHTETLAWWLTALATGHEQLDSRTVVLVDEASTLGTDELSRLLEYARRARSAVRLIGDPAQHGAVAAGGMFVALCRRRLKSVPVLRENRRQTTAVDRYVVEAVRAGRVAEALAALREAGQLTEVRDAERLYAAMVERWLHARRAGDPHPMIDRRNRTRRILNAVAHRVLQVEGEVAAAGVRTKDGREFCVGDEVVARQPARDLHPAGRPADYVRNGSRGRVVAVGRDRLTVEFESLGSVVVPRAFIEEHEDRRGRRGVGLDYGYALTSYAVQGATLPTSSSSVTAGARRRELYVNLTRGRRDNHLFVAAPSDTLSGEGHLPRPPEDDVIAEVLAAVGRPDEDLCALDIDPHALAVAEVRSGRTVAQLRAERERLEQLVDEPTARIVARAERIAANAVARAFGAEPEPWVAAILPSRPTAPWLASKWSSAVGAISAYRARWEPTPVPGGTPTGRVLGSPASDAQALERDEVLQLIGEVWAGAAVKALACHARDDPTIAGEHRALLASPPAWLRRHLAVLGASGAFAQGLPVRTLAQFYGDIAAFRLAHRCSDDVEAHSIRSLLGDRPEDPLGRRQWQVLAHRETRLREPIDRSRARAK